MNQRVAVLLLKGLGCSADIANNGTEAVRAYSTGRYDLVLMDCQMPEMDGYTAAATIRQQEPAGRRRPIIALTANAGQEVRERCLAAGMDDYLAKPVRMEDLAAILDRWAIAERTLAPQQSEKLLA